MQIKNILQAPEFSFTSTPVNTVKLDGFFITLDTSNFAEISIVATLDGEHPIELAKVVLRPNRFTKFKSIDNWSSMISSSQGAGLFERDTLADIRFARTMGLAQAASCEVAELLLTDMFADVVELYQRGLDEFDSEIDKADKLEKNTSEQAQKDLLGKCRLMTSSDISMLIINTEGAALADKGSVITVSLTLIDRVIDVTCTMPKVRAVWSLKRRDLIDLLEQAYVPK